MNMKKQVGKYLNETYKVALDRLVENKSEVSEEYDGYAASLGAAIITSGLRPALAFYTDIKNNPNNSKSKVVRYKVLNVIRDVLVEVDGIKIPKANNGLLNYVLSTDLDSLEERELKKQIIAASIALKLVLRGFNQRKTTKGSN